MPEGECEKESFHACVVGGEAGKHSPTSIAELVGELELRTSGKSNQETEGALHPVPNLLAALLGALTPVP